MPAPLPPSRALVLLLALSGTSNMADASAGGTMAQTSTSPAAGTLQLSSPAFKDGGAIPSKYTCDGANAFPALTIGGVPPGAKSVALLVDDPDAPKKGFVHAILVGISPQTTSLPEGMTGPPPGARFGVNDFNKPAWGGPCPPSGEHRYVFTIYALDVDLNDLAVPSKRDLMSAMEGHLLGQARLVGRYARQK